MDRVTQLLQSRDPAELRSAGLAVDDRGRLVSIHEARAIASRALDVDIDWQWPYRASLEREIAAMQAPARMARGTQPPPMDETATPGEWGSLLGHLSNAE